MILTKVVVGSRESALAMWQTNWVIGELQRKSPGIQFEIVGIKTEGDKVTEVPLAQIGGRGVFIKELEKALAEGRIDMAVHSMKDVPSEISAEFVLTSVAGREDVRDVLVSRLGLGLDKLPQGARIGTSSVRRSAQILNRRPNFRIVDLRGNVDTRLRKAATEQYDAVVLAAAGIKRLGLGDRITQYIPTEICLPAVAQGAMAVEFRAGEGEIQSLVALITHRPTQLAVLAERAFLKKMEGGCSIPVGAYARIEAGDLVIDGVVASVNGRRLVRARESGKPELADEIGERLADRIFEMGGRNILAEVK
ncbi:MAG: hydroxymethylbilane synthase [Dehalococcoidia bacterium]|nr:hydroxymethylbilane synthase [Dehalococcoidia bacterium]